MIINAAISKALFLALLSGIVHAQVDYDEIKTPQNKEWLHNIDLSSVPKLPVRAVGSGICPDSTCDGTDNDRCFESCGNAPSSEDIYGCVQDHQWALTFDDGPSPYTSDLLDILDNENVKATFCVMGSHVEQYPDILKRAYKAGHQIASHTFSHPHLMSLTNEEIIYEVKATEEAIEKVIGIKPHYIRPPFGEADDRVKGLLQTLGYKVLLWNVDPTDYDVYMHHNASTVIQGSFKMASQGNDTGLNLHEDPGFISLQHDLYKQSVDQVPEVIRSLKEKGYEFLTAAGCNNDNNAHTVLNKEAVINVGAAKAGKVGAGIGNIGAANAGTASDSNEVRPLSTQFPASASSTSTSNKKAAKKAATSAASKAIYSGYALSFGFLAAYVATFL